MKLRLALIPLCVVLVAGCGTDSKRVPGACRQGPDPVAAALRSAPGAVRVDGTTPISGCIKETSTGGEMADVGSAFIRVAQDLSDHAAKQPNGDAALQLGYLVGAVDRSRRGSQGVGYELGRRLDQELLAVDRRSAAFRRGLRAGRDSG